MYKKRILKIDSYCKVKGADIEDMFTPNEYLILFNGTFGRTVKIGELTGTDRIVERIERFGGKTFDHGRVAGYFIMHQAERIPKLSPETIANVEALLKALSEALPAVSGA